ncbi:hypothetical protein BGZ63DRAFT_84557 [Mariannaea sp. PMI_226]|nr:hypothetical protein BGZ63DRAFT_84557 [Mariannaea sp. PMI_226]
MNPKNRRLGFPTWFFFVAELGIVFVFEMMTYCWLIISGQNPTDRIMRREPRKERYKTPLFSIEMDWASSCSSFFFLVFWNLTHAKQTGTANTWKGEGVKVMHEYMMDGPALRML